ncbi:MAG: hypothetical protein JNN07_26565, partial [Verrucomicrobiales bacterium]|nr:hypothetical protein [Verrucomicrobiales bacterium]
TILVTASVVTGCATNSPVPSTYRTERQSAWGVQIQSIRLAPTSKGFQVSGSVGRMLGYGIPPQSHLDVETIASDGSVLARTNTTFNPNPIRRSRHSRTSSHYAVILPEPPPVGSVVRVSVHAASRSACQK